MIFFSFPRYRSFADELQIPGVSHGAWFFDHFPNGEIYIRLQSSVAREDCIIVGSIAPPEEQLTALLLLSHTLKKEGARRVRALLPYLAYSRHDKDKPNESMATAWVGSLFTPSGIDEIVTVDLHSDRDKNLFTISVRVLSTLPLFVRMIEQEHLEDATIVAPDNGAMPRAEAMRRGAGIVRKIVVFDKVRTPQGVVLSEPHGDVGARAIIVDDMLDTGKTLLGVCKKLQEAGAREIFIAVTHGLFTGNLWQGLWSLGVKKIFCTDTIQDQKRSLEPRIIVLSCVPIIRESLLMDAAV